MSEDFKSLSREYFSFLAERIYLSPSDEVLDMCLDCALKIQNILGDLMSFDTEGVEIFYNLPKLQMSFETKQPSSKVENKEILESLLKFYELPNISTKK